MLLLLGLLMSGIVKLEWFESVASLLLTHLAFFFIPIAVGLMILEHYCNIKVLPYC
jgi:holin-like protein